jgi:hypothetical protein
MLFNIIASASAIFDRNNPTLAVGRSDSRMSEGPACAGWPFEATLRAAREFRQPPTDVDLLLPLDVSNCHWSSLLIIRRHRR